MPLKAAITILRRRIPAAAVMVSYIWIVDGIVVVMVMVDGLYVVC